MVQFVFVLFQSWSGLIVPFKFGRVRTFLVICVCSDQFLSGMIVSVVIFDQSWFILVICDRLAEFDRLRSIMVVLLSFRSCLVRREFI